MNVWKSVMRYSKSYLNHILIAEICMFGTYAVYIALPIALQKLIDEGIYWKDCDRIVQCLMMYASCFLIYVLCQSVYSYHWQHLSNRLSIDLKRDVMKNILTIDSEIRGGMDTGDLMHRIDWEADQFVHIIMKNGLHFINSFVLVITILGFVGSVNRYLALLLLVAALLPIVVSRLAQKFGQKTYRHTREAKGVLVSRVIDSIQNFLPTKVSECVRWRIKLVVDGTQKYYKYECRQRWIELWVEKSIYAINLLTSILVYFYAVVLIGRQQLSLGFFLAAIEYIGLMHKKLNWMLRLYLDLNKRCISIKRVLEVMMSKKEPEGSEELDAVQSIECCNMSFSYDSAEVLREIHFKFERGQNTVIWGKSGVGKSTLLLLLEGFFDTFKGEIKVNGIPIQNIRKKSLRERIGIVLQEKYDYTGSVKAYMQMGGKEYQDDEITEVLKRVGLYDRVFEWNLNINQEFENLSQQFSGGEYQRLQIARLLLKNPDVFLLDEATAGLDTQTEKVVLDELMRDREQKIIIFVTHRRTWTEYFDHAYEIDKGRMEKCK